MRRSLHLALWFLGPSILAFLWFSLIRAFATWEGTPFEPLGFGWICLKSGYYGVVGLLFGFAILQGSRTRFVPLLLGVALIGAEQLLRDPSGVKYLNIAIDRIGYYVSRTSPPVPHDSPLRAGPLPAIPPLTQVTAHTPLGVLRITSGHGLLRTYTWDGVSRSLELIPPDPGPYGERSFHTRVFRHGERVPWHDWEDHSGITRGEAWESRKDFSTLAEADAWLAKQQNETMPYVWTNDGLVVGWSTDVDWRSLTVEIYQILIQGERPSRLAGSDDSKVVVRQAPQTGGVDALPSHADSHSRHDRRGLGAGYYHAW